MAHFVADPEPSDYWVPKISTLAIPSKNGKAKINVWHPGAAAVTLRVLSGHPRFRFFPNDRGKPHKSGLRRFVVEGLITGDQIAVFDGIGNQITAWLRISAVAIDKGTGAVPSSHNSRIKPHVTIDPFGLNSGNYPLDGSKFVAKVDAAFGRVIANPIGSLIVNALSGNVIILFSEKNNIGSHVDENPKTGDKTIQITYDDFIGSNKPGDLLDETIIHEFAHHVDGWFSDYDDIGDGLGFHKQDFFSITATNVYASIYRRPLRKDWVTGVSPMPQKYLGSAGEVKFCHAHRGNFGKVRTAIGAPLFNSIELADAPWNPFD